MDKIDDRLKEVLIKEESKLTPKGKMFNEFIKDINSEYNENSGFIIPPKDTIGKNIQFNISKSKTIATTEI